MGLAAAETIVVIVQMAVITGLEARLAFAAVRAQDAIATFGSLAIGKASIAVILIAVIAGLKLNVIL